MKPRGLLPLVLVGFIAIPALSRADDFKVPPTPDHHVTDTADALSSDTRGSLENTLSAYESATGHQIVVWIGETTGAIPLETWTGEAADRWKIGRRGHDDGAVLFLFMRDHRVRIEVGYGLESALTDAATYRIITDDIVPRMKNGDTDGAVSSGVAAMLTTISPSYKGVTPPPQVDTSTPLGGSSLFFLTVVVVFFGFVVLVVVMQIVRSIRYGYLVLREGPKRARKDMGSAGGFWSGAFVGGGSWSGGGGGGFSAGGGSFGGGGASGSW